MNSNPYWTTPPWRRRHPVLFCLGIVFLLWLLLSLGMGIYRASRPGGGLGGQYIGVVKIEGLIEDARPVLVWIEELRKDAQAVGILVRIDSPGGAVTPSEEIYTALERLAKERPMVASLGSMGASGGYMVALPARAIVANPTTLTGSIGVRMELPNMQGLMGKIGVSHESLATGDLKTAGSPFQPLTDKERAYFLGIIQDMFKRFVGMVEEHRGLKDEELKAVSDGRAVTGAQALSLGLVDSLGDERSAVSLLQVFCKSKEELPLVEGPEEENRFSLWRLIFGGMGLERAAALIDRLAGEAAAPPTVKFYYY